MDSFLKFDKGVTILLPKIELNLGHLWKKHGIFLLNYLTLSVTKRRQSSRNVACWLYYSEHISSLRRNCNYDFMSAALNSTSTYNILLAYKTALYNSSRNKKARRKKKLKKRFKLFFSQASSSEQKIDENIDFHNFAEIWRTFWFFSHAESLFSSNDNGLKFFGYWPLSFDENFWEEEEWFGIFIGATWRKEMSGSISRQIGVIWSWSK